MLTIRLYNYTSSPQHPQTYLYSHSEHKSTVFLFFNGYYVEGEEGVLKKSELAQRVKRVGWKGHD